MSDEDQVIDLIERAVASVPPRLLPAPHAAIRRRIGRRRAAGWGAATLAALLVVAGFVAVRPDPAAERPEPAASAASAVPPPDPGVPWLAARIDRTGTRITVFGAPLLGKCVERDPARDELVVTDDRVTMFLDGTYTGCADDTQVAARTFELPQAVGARLLRDARSPDGRQLIFSDTDLPDLAASGWSELTPVWLGSGSANLVLGFTRAGGPDLRVVPVLWQPEPDGRLATPDHTLVVDGRRIDVYDRAGSLAAGWSSAGDGGVRFTLEVSGAPIEKSEFDALLRGMTWS